MRKDSNSRSPEVCRFLYGADTSGLRIENATDFVRKRAYQLFEMRAHQPGHELDDWLRAEHEIKARFASF